MAYKKDIKVWLKANNLKWEDVDKMWEECCEVNSKCAMLKKAGKNWSDLNMCVICSIPTLKEETLQKQKEAEEARIRQEEHDKKVAEEKKYFSEHFDEVMVQRIDSGEEIEPCYIRELVSNDIERSYGGNRRWSRTVTSIIELCGRFFSIDWEEGLTECQDNEFYNQPVEVFKNTEVIVTIHNSWDSTKEGVVENGEVSSQFSDWLRNQNAVVNKIEFQNKIK